MGIEQRINTVIVGSIDLLIPANTQPLKDFVSFASRPKPDLCSGYTNLPGASHFSISYFTNSFTFP